MVVALMSPMGWYGGVLRYANEMTEKIKNGKMGVDAEEVRVGITPVIGPGLSFPIKTLFKDLSKYSILHNLCAYPFFPLRSGKKPVKLTTAFEFQVLLYNELNKLQNRTLKDHLWHNLVVMQSMKEILASDYIMSISEQTTSEAIGLGFPKDKVFYSPLGLDDQFLTELKKPAHGKEFKIGFIGTLSPRKNNISMIRAFRKIDDKSLALELWGKNAYSGGEIEHEIGTDKRVKLLGPLSVEKLSGVYDTFNVFLYPSTYEGFGIPIIEAKARGIPVIIYKDSKISPEVRKYCFEAEDEAHMAELIMQIKQNGYNEKQRAKAAVDARRFTWDFTAKQTVIAYKKIMQQDK